MQDGKRFGANDFEASNDAEAIARSGRLVLLRVPVLEIWKGQRLVRRSEKLTS